MYRYHDASAAVPVSYAHRRILLTASLHPLKTYCCFLNATAASNALTVLKRMMRLASGTLLIAFYSSLLMALNLALFMTSVAAVSFPCCQSSPSLEEFTSSTLCSLSSHSYKSFPNSSPCCHSPTLTLSSTHLTLAGQNSYGEI
jgi:hypothetical protein